MLIQGVLPGTDMRVIALDQPSLFDRPGLYTDESGSDWPDNPVRFAALCHAAVRVAMGGVLPHWRADIIHCNDWHTGLIPV
ncbi:glycogen/starch synthase, partial [Acinetobacter baumannii]